MKLGVLKETNSSEARVAVAPDVARKMIKFGLDLCIEQGAGERAGFTDKQYKDAGLKKREGKVYTQVIRNCSRSEIFSLISTKIAKDSVLFTDGFKTYDGLVDMGYKKHYRVHHGNNEFSKKQGNVRNHINGIENFWGLAKVRLSKFRGMSKSTFYLHLKECEFRFNHRNQDLYRLLLSMLRQKPLKLS